MYKFWIIGLILAMLEGNFVNWLIIKREQLCFELRRQKNNKLLDELLVTL